MFVQDNRADNSQGLLLKDGLMMENNFPGLGWVVDLRQALGILAGVRVSDVVCQHEASVWLSLGTVEKLQLRLGASDMQTLFSQ